MTVLRLRLAHLRKNNTTSCPFWHHPSETTRCGSTQYIQHHAHFGIPHRKEDVEEHKQYGNRKRRILRVTKRMHWSMDANLSKRLMQIRTNLHQRPDLHQRMELPVYVPIGQQGENIVSQPETAKYIPTL